MEQALWLGLVLGVAAAVAALLRWARCPGAAVLGGVAAGLLLGPTLLGRAMPSTYERIAAGGAPGRDAIRRLDATHAAAIELARRDGASAADLARRQLRYAEARRDALEPYTRPRRAAGAVVVWLVLLGSGLAGVPRAARGEPSGSAVAPVSVGVWAALLPGGLAFFGMRWWWDQGVAESAIAAAAVALGPWALTKVDRDAADEAELGGARMVQAAGWVASALAVAVALTALGSVSRLLVGLPLLGVAAAWLLRLAVPRDGGDPRAARAALEWLLVPALAALAAFEVDALGDPLGRMIWPAVLFLVLSGDVRWIGAFAGAMVLGGRRGMRTMRLVMGAIAAGPTQLAVTAIASWAGVIENRFALALVMGAVLIEVTTPARRSMAAHLTAVEEGPGPTPP